MDLIHNSPFCHETLILKINKYTYIHTYIYIYIYLHLLLFILIGSSFINFLFLRESFNLWRSLLMIAFYNQTKTPISFWCRWELNPRSFIQPSENLPVELIGIHDLHLLLIALMTSYHNLPTCKKKLLEYCGGQRLELLYWALSPIY